MTPLIRLRLAAALSWAALALFASSSLASTVVVNRFTGPKKQSVQEHVIGALAASGTPVLTDKAALVTPGSKKSSYARAAGRHDVSAFVDGEVAMKKNGWVLELTVRRGKDGEVLDTLSFKAPWLPKLLDKVDAEAGPLLAPLLDEAGSGEPLPASTKGKGKGKKEVGEAKKEPVAKKDEEPEEKPAPEEEVKEDTKEDAKDEEDRTEPTEDDSPKDEPAQEAKKDRRPRPRAVELGADFGMFSRAFEYNQDVNQNLHDYHLTLAPAAAVHGRWYPGAHFTAGVPANFGIVLDFERSVGVSSEQEAGQSFGTAMQDFSAGLRFRHAVSIAEFGASFAYGRHSFSLEGDNEPGVVAANGIAVNRDYVPDVLYEYLRPGLDGRVAIGLVHIRAGAGYRGVLSSGDVRDQTWFPHSTAAAVDASLGAGVEVVPSLIVSLAGDIRRYAFDMNAKREDLRQPRDVAGGAVDQYLTGRVGVEWRPGPSAMGGESGRWTTAANRAKRHAE